MTDCIMQHGGMVDKYIGDAIMAVFGAPLPRNRPEEVQADAIAALHAALEMHERLRSLNRQLTAQNLPLIEFGIGIHTGPLIGGTVGNRHRLNYSLFGDTVNIAARLEGMTKDLPEDAPFKLVLSADTARHTRAYFPTRLFQSGQLRGRMGHTDTYTIAAPFITAIPCPYSFPKAARLGRYSRWWGELSSLPSHMPVTTARPRHKANKPGVYIVVSCPCFYPLHPGPDKRCGPYRPARRPATCPPAYWQRWHLKQARSHPRSEQSRKSPDR